MLQPCPPDIAGLQQPYKEDLGVSSRNKSLRNRAAASETLSNNSALGELLAAAPLLLFQSENSTPLKPEVLDAPRAKKQADDAAEVVREALKTAGVKILKPAHPAEMLELASNQDLNLAGLKLFIEWKGKKAETSSLILRALLEDIHTFRKSPQGQNVWAVTKLLDQVRSPSRPAPEADKSPKFFRSATRCSRDECRGTLWYKIGGVGGARCAFCMRPDGADVLAIAAELGADRPAGPTAED